MKGSALRKKHKREGPAAAWPFLCFAMLSTARLLKRPQPHPRFPPFCEKREKMKRECPQIRFRGASARESVVIFLGFSDDERGRERKY